MQLQMTDAENNDECIQSVCNCYFYNAFYDEQSDDNNKVYCGFDGFKNSWFVF